MVAQNHKCIPSNLKSTSSTSCQSVGGGGGGGWQIYAAFYYLCLMIPHIFANKMCKFPLFQLSERVWGYLHIWDNFLGFKVQKQPSHLPYGERRVGFHKNMHISIIYVQDPTIMINICGVLHINNRNMHIFMKAHPI